MTRCSNSTKKSSQKSNTSFFYKILSSLKQLQTSKQYSNGASIDDIAKFMECKFNLSGDIPSQIENSLCIAEESRFVIRKKNLYSIVSPAATLQLIPAPCVKAKLERIQKVFNTKWCETQDECLEKKACPPRRSRSTRSSSSKGYCPPKREKPLPTPKCKSSSKSRSRSRCESTRRSKRRTRSQRRARAQEKCKQRSFSTCGYRTRSQARRRKSKKIPMSSRSFSNCGSTSYCMPDDMDSDSSEC